MSDSPSKQLFLLNFSSETESDDSEEKMLLYSIIKNNARDARSSGHAGRAALLFVVNLRCSIYFCRFPKIASRQVTSHALSATKFVLSLTAGLCSWLTSHLNNNDKHYTG